MTLQKNLKEGEDAPCTPWGLSSTEGTAGAEALGWELLTHTAREAGA